MAEKDVDNSDLRKQELDDITTCCICTEIYTDPKPLPCIHTFCMKCLQNIGLKTNKGPEDEMPCPICRRLFTIPAEGFPGLPKHFFIERLIQVSHVSNPSLTANAICSVCFEESKEQEGKETPTAKLHCLECKHKLCEECCSEHIKFKATKHHKLMLINEFESGKNVMPDLGSMICEVHEQKALDIFCADCKTVVCATCFIEEHDNHEGSHVTKYVDGFRKKIRNNTQVMNWCIAEAQVKKAELVKVKEDMQRRVECFEGDVEKRTYEIKQLIDKHANDLLQSLSYEIQSRLKEIQMATDDTDTYISNLESYNSYCQRIMDIGSDSNICSELSGLSIRAVELQKECQPIVERRIQNFKFCFKQSEVEELLDLEEDGGNLIGVVEDEGYLKPQRRNKQILPAEQSKEIDILRQKNADARKHIADYEAHIEKLKEELESNKTVASALQVSNEKLKQQLDVEKTTNKSLQTGNEKEKADFKANEEKLKQELENSETEIDKLKRELDIEIEINNTLQTRNDKEKADYKATLQKLNQDLEKNKTTISTLQANDFRLKHELRTSTHSFVETLNKYRAAVETLENKVKKLKKEPETIRAGTCMCVGEFQYKLDRVLEERKISIRGLAILDKELFVLKGGSSTANIYDSLTLSFSRRWKLEELSDPWDMGSCNKNKCLYILDYNEIRQSKEILRVDSNGHLIKKWSIGKYLGCGLSVTSESNVIAAVYYEDKLKEYSPDGQFIREINLSSSAGIRRPLYAIKLTNGYFVVSDLQGVSIVDTDGKLNKSFGGKRGSKNRQVNYPIYLTVDGNGFVMAIDRGNSRVLLLDSDLELKTGNLLKESHGLRRPERILLDETSGRLFVADNDSNNNRHLVFNSAHSAKRPIVEI